MKCCVIFNPVARGDKARRFRAQLDVIAQQAALKLTQSAGDAARLAAEAVTEGFELIVAAGGDGTVNEVVNGLDRVTNGFERAALGVLPLGTVNVFARELRLPRELDAAWAVVRRGRAQAMDLGVSLAGGERRCFVQMAGAGLDARAIELADWKLKKKIGPLAYVWAGLKALGEARPELVVRAGPRELRGQFVLVGNGRLYGGEFAIAPDARPDDGRLDVCVFPRINFLTLARCAGPLLWRKRLPEPLVQRIQAAEFSINGAAAFELDGEFAARLPASFRVEPRRLRVVVP